MKEYTYYFKTKIGPWKVMGKGDGEVLSALFIDGQRGYDALRDRAEIKGEEAGQVQGKEKSRHYLNHQCYIETEKWLEEYAQGKNPQFTPKLKLVGTPFRKLIWNELLQIPYGKTVTYGDLAEKAAATMGLDRMSAQAVGGAVGSNPVSLIVPCHRVLGKGGKLTGYQGGIDKKEYLLRLEGNSDFIVKK